MDESAHMQLVLILTVIVGQCQFCYSYLTLILSMQSNSDRV